MSNTKGETRIITNEELQVGMSKRFRDLDGEEPNIAQAKVYGSMVAKMISSVKRDMEAAQMLGSPLLPRTKRFLGVE